MLDAFSKAGRSLCLGLAFTSALAAANIPKPVKAPQINWAFLKPLEGTKLRAYVPVSTKTGKVIGKSGATIGTGFDIGQHSKTEIAKMPIPVKLKSKLQVCAGKKKNAALSCIAEHPITITPAENAKLAAAVHQDQTKKVIKAYDKHCNKKDQADRFVRLPPMVQTAFTSMYYQNGKRVNGGKFKPVISEIHKGAYPTGGNNLLKVKDPYRRRHEQEARLLKQSRPRHTL